MRMTAYSQNCHPERRRLSAARTIFVVEGPAVCMRWQSCRQSSRSLHARIDRRSRSISLVGMTIFGIVASAFAADNVSIHLAHNSPREMRTEHTLKQVLNSYDLHKYIFTREVIIEERAMNQAFPVLTLNARFADSPDELLSSFIHEQLHWYLREHHMQTEDGIAQLRRFYPRVPVGGSEGADSVYSTYGHLIDCYLEIQADRQLMGEDRTMAVIRD